jgi:acetylornithine deacetylase/succinyl-diaminopimelate desuccinylase-like protein
LAELISRVEQLIHNANKPDVKVETKVIGQRPAGEISPNHRLVKLGEECLREQEVNPVLTSGSTDANVPLSKGYPAIVLGISTGGSAHTVHEYINTEPVELGMEQLVNFVERVW